MAIPPVLIGAIAKATRKQTHNNPQFAIAKFKSISYVFSVERNGLQRSMAFDHRRDQHDPPDGASISHTRLRVLLRTRCRLGSCNVFSGFISIIGSINVCSQRVQTHLSSARIRNGNHLGHENWHHSRRNLSHDYGIDNTFDLWIMVFALIERDRRHLWLIVFLFFSPARSMCSDLVYVILFPQVRAKKST